MPSDISDQLPVHFHIDYPKAHFQQVPGTPLHIDGWAVFPDAPVHFVEVRIDGRLEFHGRLNKARPDVAPALGLSLDTDRLGFEFQLPVLGLSGGGAHQLTFRFSDEAGRRSGVVTIDFTMAETGDQKGFAQRFSEIPSHLVAKVNRDLSETVFSEIGEGVANQIVSACPELRHASRVLDFGCGLGRVLWPLHRMSPEARFTGYDIDPQMLRWAQHLHGSAPWLELCHSTLALEDASFDFVYAISVFTHLDITTEYWLFEIQRVLRPGGQAFLTFHDDTLFAEYAGGPDLPSVRQGDVLRGVHVEGKGSAEGGAAMGTFYEKSVWEALLGKYFELGHTVPRGLRGHQSYSVVRKDARSLARPDPMPYLAHLEEQLYRLREQAVVAY